MKNKKIEVGDCYEISLPNGQRAFGQYIFWDQRYGPLSVIFSQIAVEDLSLNELSSDKIMFPPVFIGFGSVFKSGRWRVLGYLPIKKFVFPKFRFSFGTKPGVYHDWKIYDGNKLVAIGDLPAKSRQFEFLCAWSPQAIEERIMDGDNMFDRIK